MFFIADYSVFIADYLIFIVDLFFLVCKWCTNAAQRCVYTLKPEFFKLFPLFCFMENYDKDEELQKSCKHTLSLMSFTLVLSRDIPVFIDALTKVRFS